MATTGSAESEERRRQLLTQLEHENVIRVAVNQEHVEHDEPIAGAREIALFPPMTGG